ncbi:hypothetical protein PFISCL1PPCAC_22846, partial [Pristionchus fissidentatus]
FLRFVHLMRKESCWARATPTEILQDCNSRFAPYTRPTTTRTVPMQVETLDGRKCGHRCPHTHVCP